MLYCGGGAFKCTRLMFGSKNNEIWNESCTWALKTKEALCPSDLSSQASLDEWGPLRGFWGQSLRCSEASLRTPITHCMDSLAFSAIKPGQKKSQFRSLARHKLAAFLSPRWPLTASLFSHASVCIQIPLAGSARKGNVTFAGECVALCLSRNCYTPRHPSGTGRAFKSQEGTCPNKDSRKRTSRHVDRTEP